jgi:2-(1,2-epoxy-1,2-dihydrophenyl)acetyl-CoA isomerase
MATTPTTPSQAVRYYYRGEKEINEVCELKSMHFNLNEETGVAICTMNAPAKLNSLSRNMIFEMLLIIEHCKRDSKVKALVWTGAGKAFSSGADFVDQKLHHDEEIANGYEKFGKAYMKSGGSVDMALKCIVVLMLELYKPSVCAVNGLCVGGTANFVLLLHDFVICAEEAKFRYPFTDLGLTPEVGSTFILPATAGMQTAKKWLMLGEWFTGQEAKDAGLALDVTKLDDLMPKALTLAEKLAAKSETIGLQKRVIHQNSYGRYVEAMDNENRTIAEASSSPAFFKAMASFSKKHSKL